MREPSYTVEPIPAQTGIAFIKAHHYSGGCHNGPLVYGLISPSGDLHGAVAFSVPGAEAVRASVFGPGHEHRVIELSRLVVLDAARRAGVPTSAFAAAAIRDLASEREDLCAVVSYADATEDHHGGIYQALNFLYAGQSASKVFYRDQDGRLRYPRQNGVNITVAEAARRGWTRERRQGKHRYVLLVGDRRRVRWAQANLRWAPQPYPKPLGAATRDGRRDPLLF